MICMILRHYVALAAPSLSKETVRETFRLHTQGTLKRSSTKIGNHLRWFEAIVRKQQGPSKYGSRYMSELRSNSKPIRYIYREMSRPQGKLLLEFTVHGPMATSTTFVFPNKNQGLWAYHDPNPVLWNMGLAWDYTVSENSWDWKHF